MLWFHEYDDLDVEIEELKNAEWGVKRELVDEELSNAELDIKQELVDEEVKVKIEDADMDG